MRRLRRITTENYLERFARTFLKHIETPKERVAIATKALHDSHGVPSAVHKRISIPLQKDGRSVLYNDEHDCVIFVHQHRDRLLAIGCKKVP